MLKLKSISPSRIKTYDMCKFKYWLTYHCPDIQLKSNWGAANGSLIHDVLENYSNDNDPDWVDRLYRGFGGTLETLDRYGKPEVMESPLVWAKTKEYHDIDPDCDDCEYAGTGTCDISGESLDNLTGCPKMLFERTKSMTEEVIDRYQDTWKDILRDEKGAPIGAEYSFKINIADTDVPILGIMDLVTEENPETIHVTDYKSGTWTQNYDECKNDIQVRMYSLACRKEFIEDVSNKGYNYKNVMLTFDYFTKYPITIAFTEEEDAATEDYVRDKIKEIESTNWINRVVRSNAAFEERTQRGGFKYFKCKYMCDTGVCSDKWEGNFKIDG